MQQGPRTWTWALMGTHGSKSLVQTHSQWDFLTGPSSCSSAATLHPPLPSPQGREKQDLIDFILLQVPPSHFFMR